MDKLTKEERDLLRIMMWVIAANEDLTNRMAVECGKTKPQFSLTVTMIRGKLSQ